MTSEHKREGLVKITGEADLFYDSIEKVYRHRMHCPYCGKYSGCRCYQKLEDAIDDIVSNVNYTCSNKHGIILMKENMEILDIAHEMDIHNIDKITEQEATKIMSILSESGDYDFEIQGEACET